MFEKKRGKRFLASVMALVMLLSLAPVGALAAKDDNESYSVNETLNIEGVETYYELSGQSNSGFTEAQLIWEKDSTVYLAFTVNYGNNGNGGKQILSATVSNDKTLEVGTTLYTNLQFEDNTPISAEGKKQNTLWQIATYTGSIQNLLNDDNQLNISTQNQGGGHELENATYTVESDLVPGEPEGDGGTPGGSDGDGDQQGTTDTVKVTYNANFEGATIEYTVPAETSVPTGADVTISKWTQSGNTVEDTTVTATKAGKTYKFKGWSTTSEPAEGSSLYAAGSNLTVDRDIMLYAIWQEKKDTAPTDPTPGSPTLVTAKFFINLGGEDASNQEGIGEFTGAITIDDALNYTLFEQKRSKDMTSNNGYIFERNGVKTVTGCEGNNLLRAEPRDTQINAALSDVNRNDLSVGGDDNRYVVWYHVSDCGNDGYHVDGYIANRPITITYDPNGGVFSSEVATDSFGKHTINDCKSGATYKIIDAIPTRDGYEFAGWKLERI